ncbi:hypothetical protein, partial [Methylobacter sp.]|uniref:hypothetical protein n=1 Tax=Methylobacter sp. TaxID=2051955 RepID=UPI003DA367E4
MLAFDIGDFSDAAAMIQSFSRAISHFSSSFHIGDDYRREPVSLRDSLKFVIQPSGKGRRSALVSEEVFKAYADSQLLAKHVV